MQSVVTAYSLKGGRYNSDVIEPAVPGHEALHAFLHPHLRAMAGGLEQRLGIGPGARHVAGLHGLEVALRLAAGGLLDGVDKVHQRHGAAVADVVERVGGGAGVGRVGAAPGLRYHVQDAHDPFDDIVDIGEVALHVAVVEHLDRLACQQRPCELEGRHVWPTPGPVDGKEAQPGGGHPVEVRVGVRHQLVGLLGGRVEADGVIHGVNGGKRHLGIHAVDRAGRGVDQVLDPVVPAPLQHIEMAHQVGFGVGMGILQRVAHPSLGSQVDYPIEALLGKQCRHSLAVGQVQLDEADIGTPGQIHQARLLQRDVVVVVEIVDTDDLVAMAEQAFGHGVSDKAGHAGNKKLHNHPMLMMLMGIISFVNPDLHHIMEI